MRSSLLLQEHTLQVLPSLAKAIGLESAIALQQVYFLLQGSHNGRVLEDGERYIFNTYEQWEEHFPWWGARTIQRVFLALEQRHLLISKQPEGVMSRRKYYRVNYGAVEKLTYEMLAEKTAEQRKRVDEGAKNGCSGSSKSGTFGGAKIGCSSYRENITENTTEIHTAESPILDECVLALASLENQDLSQITDWGKHTKACARIKERCPALTPDIIRERAANYRTHFSVSLTSTGLAKHWALCEVPHANAAQATKVAPPKMTLRQKPPSVPDEEYNTEWVARVAWLDHCRKNGLNPEK